MLGLLVIIVISWGLLYFIESEHIDVLGILPNKKRLIQLLFGFVVIIGICLLSIYVESILLEVEWKQNETINYSVIFHALVYHLKSALTEDLAFR